MAHRHSWTEVGIAEALGGEALHESAYDRVRPRIPTSSDNADGIGLLVELHQTLTVAADIGVDVERVDGVDAEGKDLIGIFLTATRGGSQNGDVDVLQVADILDDLILCEFCRLVFCAIAAYDTSHLHVGSGL